jgi:hypothetical protein
MIERLEPRTLLSLDSLFFPTVNLMPPPGPTVAGTPRTFLVAVTPALIPSISGPAPPYVGLLSPPLGYKVQENVGTPSAPVWEDIGGSTTPAVAALPDTPGTVQFRAEADAVVDADSLYDGLHLGNEPYPGYTDLTDLRSAGPGPEVFDANYTAATTDLVLSFYSAAVTLAVGAAAAPKVAVEPNSTETNSDDITLLNTAPAAQKFTQPLTVDFVDEGPPGTFSVSVSPAAAGTLSENSVTFGKVVKRISLTFTPKQDSSKPNDVTIKVTNDKGAVGNGKLTVVSVVLAASIKNADTPTGMKDRIPPRVDTPTTVTVTPDLTGSSQSVALTVTGQSDANGKATVGGMETLTITKTGVYQLRGTSQTEATAGDGGGNAGNLKVLVKVRNEDTVKSTGFSVAAIPLDWSISLKSTITAGDLRGLVVPDKWKSDSGDIADLDQVRISEQVQHGAGTGVFKDFVSENSAYLSATSFTEDTHSTLTVSIKDPGGTVTTSQVCIFLDKRTGAKNIVVANSGYTVVRTVARPDPKGKWILTMSKAGKDATANGYSSKAGAGSTGDKTFPAP